MERKNVIQEKSYSFALKIMKFTFSIPKSSSLSIVINQLLRSGTSIGANVEEAIAAFSKEDFLYKMNIALKEARESNYWLRLIRDSGVKLDYDITAMIEDSVELCKILSAIVKSSKNV